MNDAEIISKAMNTVRVDLGSYSDELAVYMVRDLQATKDAGLTDLAWLYNQNSCTHREAVALLEQLAGAVEGGASE